MTKNVGELDRTALVAALDDQRSSVRAIVLGLSEEHWHTSMVPSGRTPAGLLVHLGDAARHWTSVILHHDLAMISTTSREKKPYEPDAPFVVDWPSEKVLTCDRDETRRTEDMLAATALDSAPRGQHGSSGTDQPGTVREVVLHLTEETAAHSGT